MSKKLAVNNRDASRLEYPMRVLVVDDNTLTLDALAQLLGMSGYQVDVADDGADALKRLSLRVPDVIVLDLFMPRMSGLDFLQARDRDAALRLVPVIVLTAADGEAVERARGFPGVRVLQKPVDDRTLLDTVALLCIRTDPVHSTEIDT